jgi:chromosome segregation ATPase
MAALDQQISVLTAALTQHAEQLAEAERAKDGAQQNIRTLNATLAEREARIRALEETLSHQTLTGGQQRGELERLTDERAQLLSAAAAAQAALKAATARADEQEAAARLATDRNEDFETAVAAQRRRSEQLETEIAAVRAELQTSASALQAGGTERNELTARVAAGEARILELEARVADQQEAVRLLQAQSNASLAGAKELESDLHAAEEIINQLEAEAGGKRARVEELEKVNQEWRATVEEARHAITDRDALIQRLEQETANSAVLIGHIQKSITRLDHSAEQRGPEPAPDGATRLLIRTDGDMEVVHVLGRKTSVGRTPDNDLQIDAKFISRHHAVILVGPAHAIIEDLNSTNGVLVNNRRITRQPLKDGDNVMIGKTQFRFVVRPAR